MRSSSFSWSSALFSVVSITSGFFAAAAAVAGALGAGTGDAGAAAVGAGVLAGFEGVAAAAKAAGEGGVTLAMAAGEGATLGGAVSTELSRASHCSISAKGSMGTTGASGLIEVVLAGRCGVFAA